MFVVLEREVVEREPFCFICALADQLENVDEWAGFGARCPQSVKLGSRCLIQLVCGRVTVIFVR